MNKNTKTKRTEAALSIIVTCALVITLAVVVANAIKKGAETPNNYVDLNETIEEDSLSANNTTHTTKAAPIETPPIQAGDTPQKIEEKPTQAATASSQEAVNESDIAVAAPKSATTAFSFSANDKLNMPVNGEIALPFNMDSTIYFPTLSQYRCNDSMYILADVGTTVNCAATGRVMSVTNDNEHGNMVVLDMGNGYIAEYGQLSDIEVVKGQVVLSGTSIGKISDPSIYHQVEGSGLYFRLTKDNIAINPLDYME